MTERTQAALIMAFLPTAVVLFFSFELHEAGWLPLGAAIGLAASAIVGALTWRASKALDDGEGW